MASENELRREVANWLNQYIGIKEGSTEHKEILAIFNDSGLCTRYKMTTSDAWCAAAVSAAFIACGLSKIFPCVECSCANMITLAKNNKIWVEDDTYAPSIGDCILYDWDDTTGSKSDNTGTPDHVGIVQSISGSSFVVIEGNKNDTVGTRTMTVNDTYVRGYITPDFASAADENTKTIEEIAEEVIAGKWGNGEERKKALTEAGYDYEVIQSLVNEMLGAGTSTSSDKAPMTETAEPEAIWYFLMSTIENQYGVAGLMGNLYAESALIPINLQNSYESKLGFTDKEYTEAVDNGSYSNFTSDSAGYGLAQWTYSTRKKALLSCCESENASIGNLTAQLDYLVQELTKDFSSVMSVLKSATSVKEASDCVLTKFEKPADQSDSVKTKRAGYGQTYYDEYATVSEKKSIEEIAQEVIDGKWGNGDVRKTALTEAGYDYEAVQAKVNEMLGSSSSSGSSGSGTTSGTSSKTATEAAQKYDSSLAGTYKATANLNMRNGAGTSKSLMATVPKGTKVQNYGYYSTTSGGSKWLYVQVTLDSILYTGFCSKNYLSKV